METNHINKYLDRWFKSTELDRETIEKNLKELFPEVRDTRWLISPKKFREEYSPAAGNNLEVYSMFLLPKTSQLVLDYEAQKSETSKANNEKSTEILSDEEFKIVKLWTEILQDVWGIGLVFDTSKTPYVLTTLYIIQKWTKSDGAILSKVNHSWSKQCLGWDDYPEAHMYYSNNIKIDELLWARAVHTALYRDDSGVCDQLNEDQRIEAFETLEEIRIRLKIKEWKPLTSKEILQESNAEIRRELINMVGWSYVLEKAKVIAEEDVVIQDTKHSGETTTYTVLELNLGIEADNIPSRFVKVRDWSSEREYILPVDPRIEQTKDPVGAIAWTITYPDGSFPSREEYLQLQHQT